jgi:hypothetical protein
MNCLEYWKNLSWLNCSNFPAFSEENQKKTQADSIKLVVSPAGISNRHFDEYKNNMRLLHFFPKPPHVHTDFVVPPLGCGRSVTDFWSWGAHKARLHCPYGVSDDIPRIWAWSTRRGLKPKFYKLPRPWSLWGSSPAKKNSHGRTGNLTRDVMASSQKLWPPSHKAGRDTTWTF